MLTFRHRWLGLVAGLAGLLLLTGLLFSGVVSSVIRGDGAAEAAESPLVRARLQSARPAAAEPDPSRPKGAQVLWGD